jgi:hypothetical protein
MENNKRILRTFKEHGCMWFKPYVSYAVTVCDEDRELDQLLWFLRDTMIHCDEVVVLVDSNKTTEAVSRVLERFSPWVKVYEREFTGHFADHKNHLSSLCSGEYIFNIDADEIPSSVILENLYSIAPSADLIYVPRANLIPGASQQFLTRLSFVTTPEGFINWPDYQGRIFKKGLKWEGDIHERIQGAARTGQIPALHKAAIWHIKSIERMDKQNAYYQSRASYQKRVPAAAV